MMVVMVEKMVMCVVAVMVFVGCGGNDSDACSDEAGDDGDGCKGHGDCRGGDFCGGGGW